jgi:hypothetical protein
MNTEANTTRSKWYRIDRIKLTGEYCGGMIAGLGLGMVVVARLGEREDLQSHWPLAIFAGFVLIAVGTTVANHAQRRQALKERSCDVTLPKP